MNQNCHKNKKKWNLLNIYKIMINYNKITILNILNILINILIVMKKKRIINLYKKIYLWEV